MDNFKIKNIVYEVSIKVPRIPKGTVEILKGLLQARGLNVLDLIEQELDGQLKLAFYCQDQKTAESYVSQLGLIQLKGLKVTSGVLYQDDWLTRWKKDWKPFRLTRQIDVVPVWCKDQYKFGKRDYILLDTISSFGTGLHETTRFMAQFIDNLRGQFQSCLDVGTGTGILALVALKGGAKEVHAIDFDDMCVSAAKVNFKANGYDDANIKKKDLSKMNSKKTYDCVFANLVTHDLIQMKLNILSLVKPGGWLAVSGISLENLSDLKKGFSPLPLRCVKMIKGKYWSALLYRRIKSLKAKE